MNASKPHPADEFACRQYYASQAPIEHNVVMRKIVHIDMDAFYASVEQRDDPGLRGKPVVVAWRGARSVVCAASYEARKFGVRSAMPAIRAERLCPAAMFVPPDFTRYRAASRHVREIFLRHTDLVEPLSLDEAYLDVTENKLGLASATAVALAIRQSIREETGLTASAGIAPNKFLAKIASDWRKPDGQFVIRPEQVEAFLTPLPVAKLHGVGRVMEGKLGELGIVTVGQLRAYRRSRTRAPLRTLGPALARTLARHRRTSGRQRTADPADFRGGHFRDATCDCSKPRKPCAAWPARSGRLRRRSPSASAGPSCSSSRPATSTSSRAA